MATFALVALSLAAQPVWSRTEIIDRTRMGRPRCQALAGLPPTAAQADLAFNTRVAGLRWWKCQVGDEADRYVASQVTRSRRDVCRARFRSADPPPNAATKFSLWGMTAPRLWTGSGACPEFVPIRRYDEPEAYTTDYCGVSDETFLRLQALARPSRPASAVNLNRQTDSIHCKSSLFGLWRSYFVIVSDPAHERHFHLSGVFGWLWLRNVSVFDETDAAAPSAL